MKHAERPCDVVARAALARGPLVRDRRAWRFGQRRFSNETVARLIAAGEAELHADGRIVKAEQ